MRPICFNLIPAFFDQTLMYSLRQARLALSRPKLILREFNKLYYTTRFGREFNERGVDVFAEDWDNLILLDAFRYDAFEEAYERHGLPGELDHRVSRGAATHEFLGGNVADRNLHNTVYVTASPHYYKHDDIRGEFHDVIHVWEEEGAPDARAQPPDVMTEYAYEAAEKYPDKRLFLHYVQPHCPFIGETGRVNFQDIGWTNHVGFGDTTGADVSHESVWRAYMENVDLVMPYAREVMETLEGLNVVTSDHGQMLGERQRPIPLRDYGHPEGIYVDTLVKVPWLSYQNGPRKDVVAERPVEQRRDGEPGKAAEETLRQLGYVG